MDCNSIITLVVLVMLLGNNNCCGDPCNSCNNQCGCGIDPLALACCVLALGCSTCPNVITT